MTKEERSAYQARWRAEHPTYQRDHRRWMSAEHAKIRAEFEARKPTKRKASSGAVNGRVPYPWEIEAGL